ncbi:MAG: 23S rRNA (guanosine(2251)-2'-O)-methyltransferase RlmB [Firmicutes bacterium]|nr:23S rRNA (guanosine(2251)-2'-O)-methyltransferase RlmB [Bacillota bacterium]
MLVYGRNVLKELDKKKIRKIYVSSNELIPYLKEEKLKYDIVPKQRLDKMVKGNHQGIVIDIYDYEYYTINDIDSDFVVILDHLEDPHNFGAIIRTCECAGIKDIIIPKDRSVTVNETVVKVSVGAIEHVKIIMVSNLVNAINKLKDMNYFIYAADMGGENYQTITYPKKKALIIGNEGKGISRIVEENSDFIVSIPMKGSINSLNASTSAGILIYGMNKND